MGEPIGMILSIVLFLLLFCVGLLTGLADSVLKHFSLICWGVLIVFIVLFVVQARRSINKKAPPAAGIICSFISQMSFAFFMMLTIRDLALVAQEGILGLFGFIILFPIYGIGMGFCRWPNILSYTMPEDHSLLFLDAVLTPILVLLACWIFGFYDSVSNVWFSLLGQ